MSTSNLLRIVFLLLGIGAAALAGYLATRPQPESPPSLAQQQPPAGDEQAGAGKPAEPAAPATPSAPAAVPARAPELDIVRVEADGSMVIAGRAGAGDKVEILLDGAVVDTLTADAAGEFATVLTAALAKGSHTLQLATHSADGTAVLGTQQVAIEIVGDGQSPLVVVHDDNKPPQVVQAPPASGGEGGQQVAAAPEPAPQAPAAPEPAPQSPAAGGDGQQQIAAAPQQPAVPAPAPAAPDQPQAPAAEQPAPAVYIRAFEVSPADAGGINELALVGEAPAGAQLRVYVDDTFVGDTKADDTGRWTLQVRHPLPPGRHAVRADMLAEGGAEVIARAQVRFDRVELVAAAPQEPAAPAPAQPAPAAPAAPQPAPQAPAGGDTAGSGAAGGDGQQQVAAAPQQPAAPAPAPAQPSEPAPAQPAPAAPAAPQPAPQAPAGGGTAGGEGQQQVAAAPQQPAAPAPAPAAPAQPAPAQPAPAQPAPDAPQESAAVEIKRGDALWRIARQIYGRGIEYTLIFDANRNQIDDPNLIYPGQVFTIPVIEDKQN